MDSTRDKRASYAEAIHVVMMLLCLFLEKWGHSGFMSSLRWTRLSCAIIASAMLMAFFSTLIACCMIGFRRKSAVSLRRMVVLMLVALVDFCVVTNAVAILCRVRDGGREFWGESLSGAYAAFAQAPLGRKAADALYVKLSDVNAPAIYLSSDWPHCCFGTFNAQEPGELYVKVYEPENEELLVESPRVAHEWSANANTVFPFAHACGIARGRRSALYVVRCELWFDPSSGAGSRQVLRTFAKIHGAY